jgi:hypothetical protein
MATTTNFGWETPDDTDLVKDGAAAIRTALGGVDTSFVDLKGGTTGQVLSKASNTDLDYTWVTTDDANAIQNAIIDAKGDLIVGASADTPARLAVGTNGYYLKANSSATNGVEWAAVAAASGLTFISRTSISATNTVSINSCFNSTYDHYKILFYADTFTGDNVEVLMRLRDANDATTNYSAQRLFAANTTVSADVNNNGTDDWLIGLGDKDFPSSWASIELANPNVADPTNYVSQASGATTTHFLTLMGGWQNSTTQFTGFTLFTSAGNMTGYVDVFGYQKA